MSRVSKIENSFSANMDKKDKEYVKLQQRLKDIFSSIVKDKRKIEDIVEELDLLLTNITILNAENDSIMSMYNGDDSCMRIHKRLLENYSIDLDNMLVYEIMSYVINKIDGLLGGINASEEIIRREIMKPIRDAFKSQGMNLDISQVRDIANVFIEDKFE